MPLQKYQSEELQLGDEFHFAWNRAFYLMAFSYLEQTTIQEFLRTC